MRGVQAVRSRLGGWRRVRAERLWASATGEQALMDGEFVRKLERLSLGLGQELISGLIGEHRAVRRTSGIEFADYRQYSAGDDLRRVDWNAYARLGTLHVRQSQAEHDTTLYLLVDASPSMVSGEPSNFFAARRLAAALGYIALAHLDNVVVSAPGASGQGESTNDPAWQAITSQQLVRGRAEAGKLFRYLQELHTGSAAQFDQTVGGWSTGRGQGRIAVLISDLLLDGYKGGVRQLTAAGFQVTLLHVLSPEELAPPEVGDLELIDSETGRVMEIHLGKEAVAEYSSRLRRWLVETEEWCRSQGAGYILVQSDWDVERVVLDLLRRRRVAV